MLVCGKPSVLIPYPFAAYNHQEINARILVDKGAARIILDKDLNGVNLGNTIFYLFHHPEELNEMGKKVQVLARPQAAKEVVEHYYPVQMGR